MSYLALIAEMMDRLHAREDVVILLYNLRELKATQEKNIYLDLLCTELQDFYSSCNGIKLKWIEKSHPHFNPHIHCANKIIDNETFRRSQLPFGPASGCINIPSLEEFLTTNWEGMLFHESLKGQIVYVNDTEYDFFDFQFNLKPLDYYSETKAMNYINLNDRNIKGKLIRSDDSFSDYEDSLVVDANEYLQHIFENDGRINCRDIFVK